MKIVIPADRGLEPGESRDPSCISSTRTLVLDGSRIAACGGFRDDSRARS